MSILWYPTPKQSPLLGSLGLGGGVRSNLISGAAGGGTVDTSAAHFWDFSSNNSSPFEDQIGSLEFTTNTSNMATGNSTYGNPPGWSGGSGYFASAPSNLMRTDADACFDLSGDFCIDCCVYNANTASSTSHMAWSQGKSGSATWYIYNASGSSRFDSADDDYSDRLGEAGSADPQHNYVKDKWCVSRLRRSGNTTYVKWFVENSGGTGWDTAPNTPYSGSTTGTGPDGASNGGFLALNGWTHNGSYNLGSIAIAWLAYYTNGAKTDDPFVPS